MSEAPVGGKKTLLLAVAEVTLIPGSVNLPIPNVSHQNTLLS